MGLFSGRFNTALSPVQEQKFLAWARSTGRIGDTEDYDLRGAWKAGVRPAANGHLPDTYKKPNHPTFSQESQYSPPGQTGGQWIQAPNGKWIFMASPLNMNNMGPGGLLDYFAQREPDSIPVLPINWSLK
jgi:hypothetical protein